MLLGLELPLRPPDPHTTELVEVGSVTRYQSTPFLFLPSALLWISAVYVHENTVSAQFPILKTGTEKEGGAQ